MKCAEFLKIEQETSKASQAARAVAVFEKLRPPDQGHCPVTWGCLVEMRGLLDIPQAGGAAWGLTLLSTRLLHGPLPIILTCVYVCIHTPSCPGYRRGNRGPERRSPRPQSTPGEATSLRFARPGPVTPSCDAGPVVPLPGACPRAWGRGEGSYLKVSGAQMVKFKMPVKPSQHHRASW